MFKNTPLGVRGTTNAGYLLNENCKAITEKRNKMHKIPPKKYKMTLSSMG
jgi:hypothetical protein